ncbi:MAG: PorP/SprF family type IX secretion system membrane protein [Bacteroidota bacterium]
MSTNKKLLLILSLVFSFNILSGQQTPLSPVSYWVFVPYIYNPAIIGSKDFLSVDLNTAFMGKSSAQILSGNIRFSKTRSGYFSSPDILEFNNVGIGGSIFHNINGFSRNIGASIAGSYQIPLNTRKLSFLSFGASVKGVLNILDAGSVVTGNPSKKTFYPNLDLGIYYFGSSFFSGLSTVNLLGNPGDRDSLGVFEIPVARQYFFTAGYKIILNRSLNIVLEPSVLINAYDSTFNKISDNLNPIIKLYAGNFCVGTYFLSNGKTSFFAQFRYPKFYLGAFFELPRKAPLFKSNPTIEFTMGLNIQIDKSKLPKKSHW